MDQEPRAAEQPNWRTVQYWVDSAKVIRHFLYDVFTTHAVYALSTFLIYGLLVIEGFEIQQDRGPLGATLIRTSGIVGFPTYIGISVGAVLELAKILRKTKSLRPYEYTLITALTLLLVSLATNPYGPKQVSDFSKTLCIGAIYAKFLEISCSRYGPCTMMSQFAGINLAILFTVAALQLPEYKFLKNCYVFFEYSAIVIVWIAQFRLALQTRKWKTEKHQEAEEIKSRQRSELEQEIRETLRAEWEDEKRRELEQQISRLEVQEGHRRRYPHDDE